MSEIIINKEEIDGIIHGYSKQDKTFIIKNIIPKVYETTYNFCLDHCDCSLKVYYKKRTVRLMPIGKNIEVTNKLIKYIESFGANSKIDTYQIVLNIDDDIKNNLYKYLEENFNNFINISKDNNVVKLNATNGEWATINEYNNKIMIQSKPLIIFGIILTYISENTDLNMESVLQNLSKNNSGKYIPVADEIKRRMSSIYSKIDTTLIKTLSSSLQMLRVFKSSNVILEDYTGCLVGAFKFLESHLKNILKKLGYEFKLKGKKRGFYMFDYDSNGQTILEIGDRDISEQKQKYVIELYKIFNNKRNVYLHGSFIPDQTAIISNISDAEDICDEIIEKVVSSYIPLMEK